MEKGIENQIEKNLGGNADLDLDNEGIKIETEDGIKLETGKDVKLPENFAKDVFVPEGEIISVMDNVMANGVQVVLKSGDSIESLKKVYEQKLPEQGWKMNQTANISGTVMLGAKKDKRTISVTISPDTEESKFNLVMINIFEM